MLKVAITGNIAAGKSVVEELLRKIGYKVLDTDDVAHSLLKNEEVKAQILEKFESYDLLEDNEISRPRLAKIVFENEELRKKLESVLHPLIKDEIRQFFSIQQEQGEKLAFVSAPLLFEAKFESIFDKIIMIYTDDEIRLKRLMKRNDLPREQAENRINIQISQDEKTSLADYVIYNNETLDNLRINLEKIINKLL